MSLAIMQTDPRMSCLYAHVRRNCVDCLARSASPFWRTTSNTSKSPDNKKIIGASYSHADILKFDTLYAFGLTVQLMLISLDPFLAQVRAHVLRRLRPTVASLVFLRLVLALRDLLHRARHIHRFLTRRIMIGTMMKMRGAISCSRMMKTSSDYPV